MRILYIPDYRQNNQYQSLLGESMQRRGFEITFLNPKFMRFPLIISRVKNSHKYIHVHWPESMLRMKRGAFIKWISILAFKFDIFMFKRLNGVLIVTAHNEYPHDHNLGEFNPWEYIFKRADFIHFHTPRALDLISRKYNLSSNRLFYAPHGDLAPKITLDIDRASIAKSGFMVFGLIRPYKNIENIINIWVNNNIQEPLKIIGGCSDLSYFKKLSTLAITNNKIEIINKFLPESELVSMVDASKATIFSYDRVLTSGSILFSISVGTKAIVLNCKSWESVSFSKFGIECFDCDERYFIDYIHNNKNWILNFEEYLEWKNECSWSAVASCFVANVFKQN